MTHQVIVIREVQGSFQRLLTNSMFEHHERVNFLAMNTDAASFS